MIIAEIKKHQAQDGEIVWIGIRPNKHTPLSEVDTVCLIQGKGLDGDHYDRKDDHRQVTLIQKEHLESVAAILGRMIEPGMVRRNLVVKEINLLSLHDSKFSIGDEVILEGTGHCHPCSRMEEALGYGGYNAMRGHGGITAQIVRGGVIKLGDAVTLLSEEKS